MARAVQRWLRTLLDPICRSVRGEQMLQSRDQLRAQPRGAFAELPLAQQAAATRAVWEELGA